MGHKIEEVKQRLAALKLKQAEATPPPAEPKPPARGPSGAPRPKGPVVPPGVRKNDKRFEAKGRVPFGTNINWTYTPDGWVGQMTVPDVGTFPKTGDKLFTTLHLADDLYRAALPKEAAADGNAT